MVANENKLYKTELINVNNSKGYKRCTGIVKTNRLGFAYLTYCGRWHCWHCGEKRIELFRQASLLFTLSLESAWESTWEADFKGNPKDFDFQKAYIEAFKTWIRQVKRQCKRLGKPFSYVAVHAIGKKTGKLHTHMITSVKLPLNHSIPVEYPENFTHYLTKDNLKPSIHHDYRENWRYTHSSNDFPKPKKPTLRLESAWDFEVTLNQQTTQTASLLPMQIDKYLLTDALKLGYKSGKCSRCGRLTSRTTKKRCNFCKEYDRQYRKRKKIIQYILESSKGSEMYKSDLFNPYEIGIHSLGGDRAVNLIAEIEDEDGFWYATIYNWDMTDNSIEFYDMTDNYPSRDDLIQAITEHYK